jgi:hypothetical protein
LGAVAQVAPVATAQSQPQPAPATVATIAPPAAAPLCTDCLTVPALTPVRVELLTELGSKISKTGDTFPIRLAEPIVIDGRVVVPAGITGLGEVVHAKKSGGGGAGGELVLAARYLDVAGQRLRLRSLRVAVTGKSKIDTANAIGVASSATVPVAAFIGFLLKGGQTTIPAGTVADAKTAEAVTFATGGGIVAPPKGTTLNEESQPASTPAVQPASQEQGK